MQAIKVVVAGDGTVGKTTFLISFILNAFPQEYIPTTFDNYNAVYPFEGRNISLGLWDTAGQPDFEKLRPISYQSADVFLLFYSVVNPTSAENIKERWVAEVREHGPNVPYFLIGTQIDQRDNQTVVSELQNRGLKPLTKKDGKALAKEIGAQRYMECSAKTMNGYRDIFDEVLRYVINEAKQGKKVGKYCWSIDCRQKVNQMQRVKCQGRCHLFYCPDCIEIWEDNFKGCPQCIIYEKEERTAKGKKIPAVKKPRKPPAERILEQMEKDRIKEEKLRKKYEKQIAKGKDGNSTDKMDPSLESTDHTDHSVEGAKKSKKSDAIAGSQSEKKKSSEEEEKGKEKEDADKSDD